MSSKRVENFNKKFSEHYNTKLALTKAISLLKEYSETFSVKFNEQVNLCFNTSLIQNKADQNLKLPLDLPIAHLSKKKVLIFSNSPEIAAKFSKESVFCGGEDLIKKIEQKEINLAEFSFSVATPDLMPKISKIAKSLATKGIMPNPKLGTVTNDIVTVVEKLLNNRVFLCVDKFSSVNCLSGSLKQLTEKDIITNIKASYAAILSSRPASLKGKLINSLFVSSSMGPGFEVDLSSIES